MKLIFDYGTDALLLPAAVIRHIDKATKKDIRILLALGADPMVRVDLKAALPLVAAGLGIAVSEVETSLSFWRGTGVLQITEEEATPAVEVPPAREESVPPRVVADKGLPLYSTEELTKVLERQQGLATLIDECQNVFGKIFTSNEVSIIAGLVDYLGADAEYILLLLSHCVRMEKKSLRYVEKIAISLHDEGVTEARALEVRLHRIEEMAGATGKIRAMFGLQSRALTAKEKAMVENWVCKMQYADEVLKLAFDITVDTIQKPSMAYANSILERWYSEGYRTAEDVQRAIAEYRRKKSNSTGSFDVDDFFEAALKRTYGES